MNTTESVNNKSRALTSGYVVTNENAFLAMDVIRAAYRAGQAVTVNGREVDATWEVLSTVAAVYNNGALVVSVKTLSKKSKTGLAFLYFKTGTPLPVITIDGVAVGTNR